MVSRPFGEHISISSEYDGSGYMMCVFSESLDLLRGYLGIKIDIDHGISVKTKKRENKKNTINIVLNTCPYSS